MLYFAGLALYCKSTVENNGASNGEENEPKGVRVSTPPVSAIVIVPYIRYLP